MPDLPANARRVPLVALAALALVAGLWGGLLRLGWALPSLAPAAHGVLMINGFLGTLIGLERAVAFRRPWVFAAPTLTGLAAVGLLLQVPDALVRAAFLTGSLVLLAGFLAVYRHYYGRRLDWPSATLVAGTVAWAVGNLLWLLGQPVPRVVPWWVAFLVLTIAGERLELARVRLLTPTSIQRFVLGAGLLIAGLVTSVAAFEPGLRVAGLGLVVLGAWLLAYDVARRTIHQVGLARYVAACLLPGYAWLVVAGLLWLWPALVWGAGPGYDALLHAVLLGFVMSMIFGHAPIVLPAVAGISLPYTPVFYAPLALLHASLLLRLWGDLALQPVARQWGGLLNVVAVLLFLVVAAASALGARRHD